MSPPSSPREQAAALDELVVACLERMESEGDSALAALCASHPEQSAALKSRIATLRAAGLLGPASGEPFPDRLGDFELLARLGAGGMGVVYRARQTSLGRDVALKLIRPEHLFFDGSRDRFRREVEATARLQHPGIVPIYTVGEERGVPFFAMELVPGSSLGDVLERLRGRDFGALNGSDLLAALPGGAAGSVPAKPPGTDESGMFEGPWWECIARIGRDVAEALEHAHRRGVLHRDMKPSNVMVTASGRVLLVDFGLSSSEGAARLTRTGSQMGSLPYMPPEVVSGSTRAFDARSDVYSLGVTLYEVLTGSLPFPGEGTAAILQRIAAGRAEPLRRQNPSIPRDLEVVCQTAMEHDPARRYASAADLASDLSRVLERRPIEARPAGPGLRLLRWAQRKPAHAMAAALAVALLVGTPTALWLQQRGANVEIKSALDDAREQRDRARRSLDVAARSVEDLLARVGQRALEDIPGFEEVRKGILQDALALNEELADIDPETPEGEVRVAVARSRVGQIQALLGRNAEAERLLTQALDVLERADPGLLHEGEVAWQIAAARYQRAIVNRDLGRNEASLEDAQEAARGYGLAETAPGSTRERRGMQRRAISHAATTLYLLGRIEEGLARQRESIELARALAAEGAGADSELELGGSLCALSFQLLESGRYEEAQAALEEAVAVEERALARDPLSRDLRTALADALINLGTTHWRRASRLDGVPMYRRALVLLESLVRDYPSTPEHMAALNACRTSLAGALADVPESAEEVRQLLRDAIEGQESLCAARPEELRFRSTLAIATGNLAAVTGHTDPDAGIALFRRAMEINREVRAREPGNPGWATLDGEWSVGVFEIEARRNALPEAMAALETAQRAFPPEWRTLRRLAGMWAALSEDARTSPALDDDAREEAAEDCLARGLGALRAAVDAGYRDVADLQENRVLEPLRALPGWMDLEQRVLDLPPAKGG